MRPVNGFDRPILQWLFVASAVILIGIAGGAAWLARRANVAAETARAAEEGGRLERQQLEAQLARERSAREALTLELARAREGGGAQPARVVPTLTLTPAISRGSTPPAPTASTRHATEVIELRLVLPAPAKQYTRFEAVLRNWSTGQLVWSRGGLTSMTIDRQRAIATFVTGDLFRAGSYEVLVYGIAADGKKVELASYEIAFK